MVDFSVLLILLYATSAVAYTEEETCYQEQLKKGKRGCKMLMGPFKFDGTERCDIEYYGEAEVLKGNINIFNISTRDPLACMPNLRQIIVPLEAHYNMSPAIFIHSSVRHVETVTLNSSLTIYSMNDIWIDIQLRGYIMPWKNFSRIAGRLGSKRLNIPHAKEGECSLKRIHFLSELDNCKSNDGTLEIHSPKGLENNAKLIEVDGCIEVYNTDLELRHLHFLRGLRRVSCIATAGLFRNNSKLCLTQGFLRKYVQSFYNLKDKQETLVATMLREVSKNKYCSSTCSAEDLDLEQKSASCKNVIGMLLVRKNIVTRISEMEILNGSLIFNGYASENPMKSVPKLKEIHSTSNVPAIIIVYNMRLKYVEIPDKLNISSSAPILIRIRENKNYKMNRTEYEKLAKRFGGHKLDIDVLDEKECFFPLPVKKMTELNNCDEITGDLEIHPNVTGETSKHIKKITGCVRIVGTNLTNLRFLDRIDSRSSHQCHAGHVIANNSKLCPDYWVNRLKMTKGRQGDAMISVVQNKKVCNFACIRDHLPSAPRCSSLATNLTLGDKQISVYKKNLYAVQEVHGSIVIQQTKLKKIDMLPVLDEIIPEHDKPAIDIQENYNLEEVNFSEKLEIKDNEDREIKKSKLIVIKNNGNYKMKLKEYKKLVNKYGEDKLDIDHEEDYSYEGGMIIGIGSALLIGVLAGIVTLTVLVVITIRKKPNSQEEKKPLLRKSNVKLKSMYGDNTKSSTAVTASTDGLQLQGFTQENDTLMQGEEEEKRAEVPTVKSTMKSTMKSTLNNASNAAVTVNSAEIEHDGMLRDNVSVMKAKGGKSVLSAAKTADLATVGGKEFETKSQYNASVMMSKYSRSSVSKAKTAEPANLGGKGEFFGQLVDNKSQYNKPKTAPLAAVGKKEEYKGQERNNASVMVNGGAQKKYAPSVYVTNAQK